jgi:hypothetical protein
MSKKQPVTTIDIEKNIMTKVRSKSITMKPKWFFVLGSLSMIVGLISSFIVGTFLTNLTFFLTRQHGPMGQWRLDQIINSFPMWVPLVALGGIVFGVIFLKKYDFSYKNNFFLIALGFIATIIITAFLLDYTGLNNIWMMKQPMRRFQQQQYNNTGSTYERGQGRGMMQNY